MTCLSHELRSFFSSHRKVEILSWSALAFLIWTLPVAGTIAFRYLLLIILLGGLSWQLWQKRQRPDVPLLWPWVSYATVALISLFFSADIKYSLSEIKIEILQGFLVYFLAANLIRDLAALRRFLGFAVVGNAFLVAFSLTTSALGETTKDGLVGSLNSGVGNWSTYLVAIIPLLIVVVLDTGNRLGRANRYAIGGLCLGGIASLYFTQNRQSFVALFVELAVVAAILSSTPEGRRHLKWLLIPVAGSVMLFIVLYMQRDPLAAQSFGRALQGDVRWEAWRLCIDQLIAHPWMGGGFGLRTFEAVFPELASRSVFWHAHNTVLNKGVQMGLPGIVVFLVLIFSVIWQMMRGLKYGGTLAIAAIAGIAMVAGVFTKNMTDDFFYRESGYLFWLLSGAVVGAIRGAEQSRESAR